MIKVDIISCLNDNYSYLLYEDTSGIVAIIDPSEYEPCEKLIDKKFKKLDLILNTHHHADHIGGNDELKKKYKSRIMICKKDKDRITNYDQLLEDQENFKIGNISFKVIYIPGHTSAHIAFYSQEAKIVFTGDTLFSLGCGRIFEGTHKQMMDSLSQLKELPDDTQVYCGHEYTEKNLQFCLKYDVKNKLLIEKSDWIKNKIKLNQPTIPTTIGNEKKTNIFLRCNEMTVKEALMMNNASDQEIFSKLRDLKDSF